MGIKYFFSWVRDHFADCIVKKYGKFGVKMVQKDVDVLMLDLNGIFHNCVREVFFSQQSGRLLRPGVVQKPSPIQSYKKIVSYIDYIVSIVQPRKKVVLCIDGPAPIAKQNQQRSRRFKSARDKTEEEFRTFDTNSITPGTVFLDNMSRYIDWWIRQKVSNDWKHLDIIFSNEKVAGEGEQKIVQYVREFGRDDETYMISAMDADVIMLSLATHRPNIYVLRETMMPYNGSFFIINVGDMRERLMTLMKWEKDTDIFSSRLAINDFVFLCFFIGNDFLPQVPTIEVMKGGIDTMLNIYRCMGKHLTTETEKGIVFQKKPFHEFLTTLCTYEVDVLKDKLEHKELYHEHKVLEDLVHFDELYSEEKFGMFEEKYVLDYLDGMQWVMTYYTRGAPSWEWSYKNHYAPLIVHLHRHMNMYETKTYEKTTPTPPVLQLLCVLPPKSFELLPDGFKDAYMDKRVHSLYPNEFEVDMRGKRKDWEGIPILPFLNISTMKKVYQDRIGQLSERDKKRNTLGRNMIYKYTTNTSEFKSYYGDVNVMCESMFINF
jgi:5'-3' exonuclease